MKLHLTNFSDLNAFTGYGPDYVEVNQLKYKCNLIVLPDQIIENWQVVDINQLNIQHLEDLLRMQPEIILIGTGATFRFPDRSLLRNIASRAISLEVMDTQATCRTYNILSAEGRRVAAAMFVETADE
ncbi:MAG: Mth938-like domain-containing protein [Nitrosomonas sp.]|nr:Mth938-like domain-containing protein [Nitrosomonas sp.]